MSFPQKYWVETKADKIYPGSKLVDEVLETNSLKTR